MIFQRTSKNKKMNFLSSFNLTRPLGRVSPRFFKVFFQAKAWEFRPRWACRDTFRALKSDRGVVWGRGVQIFEINNQGGWVRETLTESTRSGVVIPWDRRLIDHTTFRMSCVLDLTQPLPKKLPVVVLSSFKALKEDDKVNWG